MARFGPLILALVLAVILPASGATQSAQRQNTETALVTAVPDGNTLVVDRALRGTTEIRLAGIEAPKLGLGRPGFSDWPLAHAAREMLEALALGRRVRITYGGAAIDRHRRLHADVRRDDAVWLQDEMLRRGWARVRAFAWGSADLGAMLAREHEARTARLGIWSHPFYAVRTPEAVERDIDSFQIVEGRVVAAARVRTRIYLNFGKDWRTDFTVAIATRDLADFEAAGIVPLALEGRVVRVRGWIDTFNGPLIEATHPAQIEIVEAEPAARRG